jgi:hypothetical protein
VDVKPCLIWTGATDKDGYGKRDPLGGRSWYVHRQVIAEDLGWEAIEGRVILHACDTPSCYERTHLSVGSQTDNMQDAISKGRLHDTSGEGNARAKLSTEQVREIRSSTESYSRIAVRYGVSKSTVAGIKTGRTWRVAG